LLLVQYFWLFVFAYESPPEVPIGDEVIVEEFVQDDSLVQEEASEQEQFIPVESLDGSLEDIQEEEVEEVIIADQELEDLLYVTDVDTVDTGDVVSEPVVEELPLLLITEVYFGGTDERFELYNPHDTPFF